MPLDCRYHVVGWKDVEKGGIYGTFWRVPDRMPWKDWTEVMKAGGPGAITPGTEFDDTLGGRSR